MSNAYGSNQIGSFGKGQKALVNREHARFKHGGVTIDWATVDAVAGTAVTLDDGTVIAVGDKYIRYGTPIARITATDLFGPVDTGASDGREVVTNAVRGNAYILDETVIQSDNGDRAVGGAFDGGIVFRDHLNIGYSGAPTEANIETMFPDVTFLNDLA